MAEREMPSGRAFVATGQQTTGVQCCNPKRIGGFLPRPLQKLRARCSHAEGAADRAWPPTARKQFWRIDAEANSNDRLITSDSRGDKTLAASGMVFSQCDERGNNYATDARSGPTVDVIHLATVC